LKAQPNKNQKPVGLQLGLHNTGLNFEELAFSRFFLTFGLFENFLSYIAQHYAALLSNKLSVRHLDVHKRNHPDLHMHLTYMYSPAHWIPARIKEMLKNFNFIVVLPTHVDGAEGWAEHTWPAR
jgi:hypothetical protein